MVPPAGPVEAYIGRQLGWQSSQNQKCVTNVVEYTGKLDSLIINLFLNDICATVSSIVCVCVCMCGCVCVCVCTGMVAYTGCHRAVKLSERIGRRTLELYIF